MSTSERWVRNQQANTIRREDGRFVADLNGVTEADARKMIAAPQLLEAVERVLLLHDDPDQRARGYSEMQLDPDTFELLRSAQRAAQATGQP